MIYPLRDYARAWYRGNEMKSLFIAGDKVWTKVKTIKDYYGIGPGQIPIHHTPSNTAYIETFAGGRVSRSINRGGAGTVFDMAGVAGVAPRIEENAFFFNLVAGANLQFATQPDVNGVHIVAAGYRDPTQPIQQQARILSGSGTNGWWTFLSAGAVSWAARVNFSTLGVNLSPAIDNALYVGWGIHELRVSEGQATYIVNGVTVGSSPITSAVATYVSHLGALRATDYSPKYIGDFGSVICAAGYSAANPEPAVILLRQRLAAKYGVEIAPPPPSLADYYGTGPGQIPMDIRLDDPAKVTLSAGLVTGVVNDGGAGALFNASAPAGREPTYYPSPGEAYFGAGSWRELIFANAADLYNTHVLIPLNIPTDYPIHASASRFLVGGGSSIGVRRPNAETLFIWVSTAESAAIGVTVPFSAGRRIYGIRMASGKAKFFRNGDSIGDAAIPFSVFPVDRLGNSTTNSPSTNKIWPSVIGRVISVVVENDTATYPAISLAMAELAAQYWVSL